MSKFCINCGNEIPDRGKFCAVCGEKALDLQNKVSAMEPEQISPSNPEPVTAPVFPRRKVEDNPCPNCGNDSSDCQFISKSQSTTKYSPFGMGDACCGMILLGPAGILCGFCGGTSTTKQNDSTWWVCRHCHEEFLTKKSAMEIADKSFLGALGYSWFVIGMTYLEESTWLWNLIFLSFLFGVWSAIPRSMVANTGLPLKELLTPEERAMFWMKMVGLVLVSWLIGISLMGGG